MTCSSVLLIKHIETDEQTAQCGKEAKRSSNSHRIHPQVQPCTQGWHIELVRDGTHPRPKARATGGELLGLSILTGNEKLAAIGIVKIETVDGQHFVVARVKHPLRPFMQRIYPQDRRVDPPLGNLLRCGIGHRLHGLRSICHHRA